MGRRVSTNPRLRTNESSHKDTEISKAQHHFLLRDFVAPWLPEKTLPEHNTLNCVAQLRWMVLRRESGISQSFRSDWWKDCRWEWHFVPSPLASVLLGLSATVQVPATYPVMQPVDDSRRSTSLPSPPMPRLRQGVRWRPGLWRLRQRSR